LSMWVVGIRNHCRTDEDEDEDEWVVLEASAAVELTRPTNRRVNSKN
jgi:hypothetical protein